MKHIVKELGDFIVVATHRAGIAAAREEIKTFPPDLQIRRAVGKRHVEGFLAIHGDVARRVGDVAGGPRFTKSQKAALQSILHAAIENSCSCGPEEPGEPLRTRHDRNCHLSMMRKDIRAVEKMLGNEGGGL